MRLVSITAKKQKDSRDITWGFRHGSGGYKSLFRYYGTPEELSDLRAAITALFSAQKILERVWVDFIDNSGHKWRFVKTQNQITAFLDGKAVNLSDFAEDDTVKAWISWQSIGSAHERLFTEEEVLLATKYKGDQGVTAELSRITNEELGSIIKDCGRLLDTKTVWEPKDLLSFLETLRVKYYESHALVSEYKELVKKSPYNQPAGHERLVELRTQVQILSQMENILQSFGSGAHFQEFAKTLLRCEEDFRGLCEKIRLDQTLINQGINWEELFARFAQSFLSEQVLKQGTHQLEKASQLLGSGLKHHLALLLESLGNQSTFAKTVRDVKIQLTSQGKAFSEDLGKLENSTSYKILKSVLKTHIEEFRKSHKDMQDLGHELTRVMDLNATYRECLANSSETLRNLDKNLLSFKSVLQSQFDDAKKAQIHISEALGLPVIQGMDDLVSIASSLGQVFIKAKELALYQDIYTHFQQRLQTLTVLLVEWYEKTSSQKSIDLSNAAIVLSEAHNLLRFKADRQAKLEQLQGRMVEERLYAQTKAYLERKAKTLQESWKGVFLNKNLPVVSIKSPSLPGLFEKADMLKGVLSLNSRFDMGERKTAFFEGLLPFSTWTLLGEGLSYKDKLLVMERLKNFKPDQFNFLLSDDGELSSMLTGTSIGEISRIDESGTNPVKPLENKEIRPPLNTNISLWTTSEVLGRERRGTVSSKAQEVVDLLNGIKRS